MKILDPWGLEGEILRVAIQLELTLPGDLEDSCIETRWGPHRRSCVFTCSHSSFMDKVDPRLTLEVAVLLVKKWAETPPIACKRTFYTASQ